MNQTVKDTLTRARTQLILDHPFFGMLALRLPLVEDANIPTACVDGKQIRYNPTFVSQLSATEVKTLVAHEVMHCVYDHMSRRDSRHPRTWNQAGDYVINLTLSDSGFDPIKGWLHSTTYKGMSTDEVYGMLPPPDDKDGKDPLDECQDGSPEDAIDWKIATIQAANTARMEGKLPASLARFVEELTAVKIDWRAALRRFITETAKDDYSWMRPNRRFIEAGFFLPTLYSETMGEIVTVIDTSGSITQEILNTFGAEIKAIIQHAKPSKTYVIYCDSEVNQIDEFSPTDDIKFAMHGGGGTSFIPPFEYCIQHNIKPVCLIYLTDLYGPFGDPPEFPVMWVCTTEKTAPWGETIPIEV